MDIRTNRTGRTSTIFLKGAIVLGAGGGSLRHAVARALDEGSTRVEIDASGLTFLDAAGLGELVACRAMAKTRGARLRIRGVNGKARELLRMTGLERSLLGQIRPALFDGIRWRVA